MGWLKDWGSYIISVLGIIGGLWGYFRHDKKLKSQEKIINDMQIRQMRKTEDKECQAEIKAEFVKKTVTDRIVFALQTQDKQMHPMYE